MLICRKSPFKGYIKDVQGYQKQPFEVKATTYPKAKGYS
jgi:hypothetical protein